MLKIPWRERERKGGTSESDCAAIHRILITWHDVKAPESIRLAQGLMGFSLSKSALRLFSLSSSLTLSLDTLLRLVWNFVCLCMLRLPPVLYSIKKIKTMFHSTSFSPRTSFHFDQLVQSTPWKWKWFFSIRFLSSIKQWIQCKSLLSRMAVQLPLHRVD